MAIVPPFRPNPSIWQDLPENVGRLPREITGDFGALKSLGGVTRFKVAGSLPSSIPGNFNNRKPDLDIPYGSVGFTLVCRSASDFTTILAILYDFASMSYSEELSGVGSGSVTLNRDDPFIADQLINGVDLEVLLEKDNLWEVYFDGKRRFQWLGQNVQEPKINESESRTVTISGPGIGQSLDWALVFPSRLQGGKDKLAEAVRDDFIDQDVDIYGLWTDNLGTVQALNGRVALKVTVAGGLGSYISTAVNYDFVDSGAQALVVPAVFSGSAAGNGKVRTYMSIEESSSNYARIYTDLSPADNVTPVLVAQVAGPGGVLTSLTTYNGTAQRYWRIQELGGKAIFSYRAENTTEANWVIFATLPYSFNASSVRLRLRADAVAGGNITLPQTSYFSSVNIDGVGSTVVPFEKFRNLIKQAQSRGSIRHIIPNWTPQADSMGAAWFESPTITVNVGADLLSVLDDFCKAQQADWFMDSDYRLHIRQRVWSTSGNDPTAPFHKEDDVIFYEAESQDSKERKRAYSGVRNYVIGKTENDEYTIQSDTASISTFQQREILVSDTLAARDVPSLEKVLANHLATSKNGAVSWTLTVPYNVEGKRLYDDYQLGDWVSVQTTFPHQLDSWRISAISVQVGSDGDPEVELTLNDKLNPYWHKIKEDVIRGRYYSRVISNPRSRNWPTV